MADIHAEAILHSCMPEYRVVERIGSGNFGCVYRCERDGLYYAIKIISVPSSELELQQLLTDSSRQSVMQYLNLKEENYRNEIKVMAELKGNRNIVNIEDYKIIKAESGMGFHIAIRMELLSSLVSYTATHSMGRDQIIQLGLDMCDALILCEKYHIIHRDIKPENVLVHKDGAFKLGDFGVAKHLSRNNRGTVAGTEGFMAPEVVKRMEYDHTADIYSLGVLLYYYLNNRKMPYVNPDDTDIQTMQDAITKRLNCDAVLPPPAYADRSLADIVLKACMYNKADRFQSAVEMRKALLAVQDTATEIFHSISNSEEMLMVNNDFGTQNSGTVGPFSETMYEAGMKQNSLGQPTDELEEEPVHKKTYKHIAVAAGICCIGILMLIVFGISRDGNTRGSDNTQQLQALEIPENTKKNQDADNAQQMKTEEIQNLIGILESEARAKLESKGLLVTIEYADADGAHSNRVLSWKQTSEQSVTLQVGKLTPYQFDEAENGITITGVEKHESFMLIPDTINGKSVTAIGSYAFKEEEDSIAVIRQITMPKGIERIGEGAFMNCLHLEKVDIPDGVKDIGDGAFWNCASLSEFDFPNKLKSVGDYAFQYCMSLSSIILPEGCVSIGTEAFSGCAFAETIVVPASVLRIGDGAFTDCISATLKVIPKTAGDNYAQSSDLPFEYVN